MMLELVEAEPMLAERQMLVRFCARYTGDWDAAEDLAQQTLLTAWQREQQLRDGAARKNWLFAIARNTCLMWGRSRGRELAHRADIGLANGRNLEEWSVDDVDVELELERDELATILDRALALLPVDTREVLIRRYIEGSSQAEVAAFMGVTEGAVEARLHRGKLALKRVLATDLSREAVAFGLVAPDKVGWQGTRIWCPGCGRRTLEGRLDSDAGRLVLRCAGCEMPYNPYINAFEGGLQDIKSFKPALSRVLTGIHNLVYRLRPVDGLVRCPGCGLILPIRPHVAHGIHLHCPHCDICDCETWHSLTWSLPEVGRFSREHRRMRFLPEREIEVEGVPAVVTGFESMTNEARLEVVMLRDSLEVVRIHGSCA